MSLAITRQGGGRKSLFRRVEPSEVKSSLSKCKLSIALGGTFLI